MSTPGAHEAVAPLLDVWFGDACESPEACVARRALWFAPDDAFDRALRARFDALPERARAGALDGWRSSPRGALALVITLDQLPRNLHRDSARAFCSRASWYGAFSRKSLSAAARRIASES